MMQLNETSNIGSVKVKSAAGEKHVTVRLQMRCLICVNIIKSTSTMRCRRQSVFDDDSEKRPPVPFLEKPAASHPFFRRAEKTLLHKPENHRYCKKGKPGIFLFAKVE